MTVRVLVMVVCVVSVGAAGDAMPLPWTRPLQHTSPAMTGSDVTIAQALLNRWSGSNALNESGVYDAATADAVSQFRSAFRIGSGGATFDSATAEKLLEVASDDGYKDDGQPASARGKLYKIFVPVHRNRSIETWATLSNATGAVLLAFKVHAHGKDTRNLFTNDGNTPTGLMSLDFNSPEPDPVSYGPYPINRAVAGIRTPGPQSNAELLVPNIRSGILVHTGEWPEWKPPMEMPNSEGCIHSWPQFIQQIALILPTLGVKMRNNTGGAMPYPYETQGILSVELIDE